MTGTVKTTKEPLFHVVKHAERTGRQMIGFRLLAVALSIVAGGLFILAIGHNPIAVYGTILEGAFRSKIAIQSTVKFAIPLCICALGVTLAFKMKFWNIGGEGQLIMGAVFASYFALNFPHWNHWVLLLVMLVAGALGGGLWGLLAAAFKVKWGTNETLLTLMLNYIALYALIFLGETKAEWNFLLNPESARPTFGSFASLASFPGISIGKFNLNVCVILTFVIGVLVFIYLKYTKHGYEIAVVGDSVGTARYAGIKVNRVVLRTVFLSACLIGLAAAFKVGTAGILSTAITDDVGWTGVIVAWLAKLNTVGIFLVSALIGVLDYGSTVAASSFSAVDSSFANMLQGVILFTVLTADFLIRFRVVIARKGEPAHE